TGLDRRNDAAAGVQAAAAVDVDLAILGDHLHVERLPLPDSQPLDVARRYPEQSAERLRPVFATERLHQEGRKVADLDVDFELLIDLVDHRRLHFDEQARQV